MTQIGIGVKQAHPTWTRVQRRRASHAFGLSARGPSADTPGMPTCIRTLLLATCALACAGTTVPAAAGAKSYDVPAVMGDTLIALVEQTPVGVLLPQTLPLGFGGKLYATADASTATSWSVTLAAAPDCNGANVCSMAYLSGNLKGKRSNKVKVRLADGKNGWFRGLSCGASCSPPSIQFVRQKTLYEISAKVVQKGKSDRQILTAAANSAIRNGNR